MSKDGNEELLEYGEYFICEECSSMISVDVLDADVESGIFIGEDNQLLHECGMDDEGEDMIGTATIANVFIQVVKDNREKEIIQKLIEKEEEED